MPVPSEETGTELTWERIVIDVFADDFKLLESLRLELVSNNNA